MWKEYSSGYIKNNRASSISIIAAALVSSLLLSFLCSLFYNFWVGELHNIISEEGNWQGRITGELTDKQLSVIQNFGNVEEVTVNKEYSEGDSITADIIFKNPRTIFQDMPLLVKQLELPKEAASYHIVLLSRYLIHDPQDESPPLLLSFYLAVLVIVSLSLILIIRNSFALSMNERIHQFGIFSSIGATPGQIRMCLMQEAFMLCLIPILFGSITGILLSMGVNHAMNLMAERIAGAYTSKWVYHPLIFAVTLSASLLTVLISAWFPARKLSRMTPLQAIMNRNEAGLKRKKHSRLLALLFGIEGELAGNALKVQKKAMRTSTLSLTLSFLGFSLILCFFTLSGISTRYTYFDRYQDAWDIMAAVEDTKIEDFQETQAIREIPQAADVITYQKAEAVCSVPQDTLSEEVTTLGGLEALAKESVSGEGDLWNVKAPIIIMDDESFLKYCEKEGLPQRLDGTVVLNQIWDSINSNFRYAKYVPFLTGQQEAIHLQNTQNPEETTELPVIGYSREAPVLREEYSDYSLVQFIPLSLWKSISSQTGMADTDTDTYVRILTETRDSLSAMNAVEQDISYLLLPKYEAEIENRIQEKLSNDDMIFGYTLILGGLCAILALIGIANVFSNTLGFLRQRKREFARYLSVGMTPAALRKMFCIEALVIAGRPLLITLPLTVILVGFMIAASYLNPAEFIAEAPFLPIFIFCMAIFVFVGLAYCLGARKVLRCNLAEALKDDTIA